MRWVGLFVIVVALSACGGGDGDGDASGFFAIDDSSTTDDESDTAEPADDGSEFDNEPVEEPPAGDAPAAAPEGVDRSAELIGTWNITFYALPNGGGRTNVIDGDAPVQITFETGGAVSYHTGCNAGGTTYATDGVYVVPESALDETPEGQPLTIDSEAMSEGELCEGFLGEQDVDLPAAWRQAERFRLDGDRLILSAEFFLLEAERG